MRVLKVIVTDEDGCLLDREEIEVPLGVTRLLVAPILPGSEPIINSNQIDLEIGRELSWS